MMLMVLVAHAQDQNARLRGKILSVNNAQPLENVHVINLSTYQGTITDQYGVFQLEAVPNDTIFFSAMGFKQERVVVTAAMMGKDINVFYMINKSYQLDEVVLSPYAYNLTGILELDVRALDPYERRKVVKIAGVKTTDQVTTKPKKPSIMNPIDFLNSKFGKEAKQMKKLDKISKNDEIYDILSKKYDRVLVGEMFNMSKEEIEELLLKCDYDPEWVIKASDLEVLQAVKDCYERFEGDKQ